jgi:hypothetical protein
MDADTEPGGLLLDRQLPACDGRRFTAVAKHHAEALTGEAERR